VVRTAIKLPLFWGNDLEGCDTTGTLSFGGVVCYLLRWKMIMHFKLERLMEETGIQNYGPHFI
jgi:hypothetical protein